MAGNIIFYGILGLLLLNIFMDFIVTIIVGILDLSFIAFGIDFSGWIEGIIAGLLNAIFILFIGLSKYRDDEK